MSEIVLFQEGGATEAKQDDILAALAGLESVSVTVLNPTTGFATETTLASVLTALQGTLSTTVTNAVDLSAATLAALENTSVTVTNQISGFATQTTLAALLAELQAQQKNGLTDAELRASAIPVSSTNFDIRSLTFARDKVDVSGSTVNATGTVALDAPTLAALENVNVQNTVAISAANLPLPTGAATSAAQLPDNHQVQVSNFPAIQPVSATDLDIRNLAFAQDKVDVSASVIALDAPTLTALETVTVNQGTPQWNTIDRFTGGQVLNAQTATLTGVLTFNFSTPVDLCYVFLVDNQNHSAYCDPFGGVPSPSQGIPILPGVPQSFPVTTNSINVYTDNGATIFVWGYRYP